MNRIDQIAREKLLHHEIKPALTSWDAVSSRIHENKTPFHWYLRAAVVVIAMTVGLISYVTLRDEKTFVATADMPAPFYHSAITWTAPAIVNEIKPKQTGILPVTVAVMVTSETAEKMSDEPMLIVSEISLAKVDALLSDPLMPTLPEPFWVKSKAVEDNQIIIKYYASNASDNTEKPLIEKILTLAQQTTPANLISDIREAKGDMFRNKATVY